MDNKTEEPSNRDTNEQNISNASAEKTTLSTNPTASAATVKAAGRGKQDEIYTKAREQYQPIKEKGFSGILNHLLRKPMAVVYTLNHPENRSENSTSDGAERGAEKSTATPLQQLFLMTLCSLMVFGFVVGMFSAGNQLWIAPMKIIMGMGISVLICLPSLYIFSCLSGMDVKWHQITGLMCVLVALTSVLLVGFAPVLWLFSTSSQSISFFGFLCMAVWAVGVLFGIRVVSHASKCMGANTSTHLKVWACIFFVVTLQMSTTLRPIIGTSDKMFHFEEKKFFLQHWMDSENSRVETIEYNE